MTREDIAALRERLAGAGQEHLLRFWEELDDAGRARLQGALEALPLDELPRLARIASSGSVAEALDPGSLAPLEHYPADPADPQRPWDRQAAVRAGEALLAQGKVALLTVAGGQGTRLGFNGPKGCFPAAPVTGKPLFRLLAEWVAAARRRYDAAIPWAIMTSPLNHEQTVSFFRDQRWFGLPPGDVLFFTQGVVPTFDAATGRALLAAKDLPATNPDGHGGTIRALWESGTAAHLQERGVEHLSYVQVDNPLVKPFDPAFLGLHVLAEDSSAQMSSKMVRKVDPQERVGVFCRRDGRACVVEYSDLPEELAQLRDEHGGLRFCAGSPAIHVLSLAFVEELCQDGAAEALPWHRARKKAPHVDLETGRLVEPEEPNAIKLETFIFDALPLCRSSIVLEALREEEFAPIKNASGKDSPQTSRAAQIARACRWLEQAGVEIPRDQATGEPLCAVEISPLTAMAPEDLTQADLPRSIEPGEAIAL